VGGVSITPEAGRVAIEEAADRPYGQATTHLRKHHRIGISKHTLERLADDVGRYWLERDRVAFERLDQSWPNVPGEQADAAARRCLIFADGVMVHTDGDWHEARVGTVRTEDADQQTLDKSSIVRMTDVDRFGEDLWRRASELGYHQCAIAAFIGDGSHWLWRLAGKHFDKAICILDFYHLMEHVHRCATVFFGEGTETHRQWALVLKGTLRAGCVDEALKIVEALAVCDDEARRQAKHELITYLTNNRQRMDYPRYESLGLPIGSGEVEAQCKTLVQARCKQAGMRWRRERLESLLRIRCAVRDNRYDREFARWPTNFTAWRIKQRGPTPRPSKTAA